MKRDKRLNILVSAEEHAMLGELADADGLSPSDLVRQFIRRQHAERFGAASPAVKTPRRRKRKR